MASYQQQTKLHVCFIIPPFLLQDILRSNQISPNTHAAAQKTLNHCSKLQTQIQTRRTELSVPAMKSMVHESTSDAHVPDTLHRAVYSSKKTNILRKTLLLEDGNSIGASTDVNANNVFDSFQKTYKFYQDILKRISIDGNNLELIGSVHYDDEPGPPGMDNAFWNGKEMAFGDGDGEIFSSFTKNVDVIGHELTHGVVQYTANLEYEYQSGALNESLADVFGSMIKQYSCPGGKQTAADADWLIGEGIFLPEITNAKALRSMKAPGTAYNNPKIGKDSQPADMDGYKDTPNTDVGDWGGVHTNSGIPNHAFYLAATALGGYSWEKAGRVWYAALNDDSLKNIDTKKAFRIFADLTVKYALSLFDKKTQAAVKQAWTDVKVLSAVEEAEDDL